MVMGYPTATVREHLHASLCLYMCVETRIGAQVQHASPRGGGGGGGGERAIKKAK
jgi:hypothetical protein